MSDIAIRVEGLSKQYRIGGKQERYRTLRDTLAGLGRRKTSESETFWALQDVSFEVKRGEVVGIIGRNGAGKSTLLKILSRITEPTAGTIDIYGRVGSLLEVGTGFHPELSGRENIFLNGAIIGMSRRDIERRFEEIVAFAEVEKFIDTAVKHYSSGMYLRLAFAVAAHLEPEILIVDEVLAVGDAAFQKKCLGKMQDVAGQGRTVLFVSHNMGAVKGLCSRVIWLENGNLHEVGEVVPVIDSYLRSTLTETGSLLDLDALTRTGTRDTGLKLTGIVFNDNTPLYHNQPLKIVMTYECVSPLEEVSIGIGFASPEGVRICTIDSDLLAPRRALLPNRSGKVEITLERFDLQPGRYTLDIGARSGDHFALDYLPSCGVVEVYPSEATPSFLIGSSGGVRIPADFHWHG